MKKLKVISKKSKVFFALTLVTFGVLFRTLWHVGPNIEFVTAATLLASYYLGKRFALIVPLVIMIISDMIIGNSSIFIFTWSAYFIIGIFSSIFRNSEIRSQKWVFGNSVFLAIISSVWFYLWTNFGVWLLDSWGMYPKTLPGLIDAYILAVPFFKYNLFSNLVIIPASFMIAEYVKNILLLINVRFISKNI